MKFRRNMGEIILSTSVVAEILDLKRDSKHELPRKLDAIDATAIVIGIVIGSGIFLLPNVIARGAIVF